MYEQGYRRKAAKRARKAIFVLSAEVHFVRNEKDSELYLLAAFRAQCRGIARKLNPAGCV